MSPILCFLLSIPVQLYRIRFSSVGSFQVGNHRERCSTHLLLQAYTGCTEAGLSTCVINKASISVSQMFPCIHRFGLFEEEPWRQSPISF